MRQIILLCLIIACFSVPANAIAPWIDTWNDLAFHTTNGESKNFNAFLGRSEIRAGLYLTEKSSEIPPVAPYLTSVYVGGQDENYWNNQFAGGYGIRILPFARFMGVSSEECWYKDVKIFAEVLTLSILQDESAAQKNNVPLTDKRAGIDLYYEWNQKHPDKKLPWTESWSNFSFRTTNFSEPNFKNYVFLHQQKIGMHMDNNVKPYFRAELAASGRPDPWLNSLYLGLGVRVEPFRDDPSSPFCNLKMYLENMSIIWYKEKDSRPQSDVRFGIDYRLF